MAGLALLVFLAIFTLAAIAVLLTRFLMDRMRPETEQTEADESAQMWQAEQEDEESYLLRQAEVSSISPWAWMLRRFNLVDRLNKQLVAADLDWSVGRVSLAMLLCGTIALAFLMKVQWLPLGAALILAVIASQAPYFYISHRTEKRRRQIEEQFPDALDSLSRAMRAGYAFGGAFDNVANQTPNPLGKELKQTAAEGALGVTWDQALGAMMHRLPLQEVCVFVAAVRMQNKSGGNLSEVLEKLAENMRESAALAGEVRAISAQGRFAGYILTALPIGIAGLLFVVNPDLIMVLVTDPTGKLLLTGSVLGVVAAHFVIRKLVEIKL
jgi:tight adherence protein B